MLATGALVYHVKPTPSEIERLGLVLPEALIVWMSDSEPCLMSETKCTMCMEHIILLLNRLQPGAAADVIYPAEMFWLMHTHKKECMQSVYALRTWLLTHPDLIRITAGDTQKALSSMAPAMWQSAWVWLHDNELESCPARTNAPGARRAGFVSFFYYQHYNYIAELAAWKCAFSFRGISTQEVNRLMHANHHCAILRKAQGDHFDMWLGWIYEMVQADCADASYTDRSYSLLLDEVFLAILPIVLKAHEGMH